MNLVFIKWGAIGFIGLALFVGLVMNGKVIYPWLFGKVKSEAEQISKLLDEMFVEATKSKVEKLLLIFQISMIGLGLLFGAPNLGLGLFLGILFMVVGFRIPRKTIEILHAKRIKKFVVQMVDGLALMSNGMRSGLNVPQALTMLIDELPNPISQEFNLVLSQNKLGISLEDALSNLSVRMPHDDIEMFTTSVNILKETGGNLAETFDTIAYTIRERIKIEAKISAMVSQGVMQGVIVVLMPFALGAILYTVDPERIRPMFTTIPGWAMLSFMMLLQFAGGYTIWKIVQVKV